MSVIINRSNGEHNGPPLHIDYREVYFIGARLNGERLK